MTIFQIAKMVRRATRRRAALKRRLEEEVTKGAEVRQLTIRKIGYDRVLSHLKAIVDYRTKRTPFRCALPRKVQRRLGLRPPLDVELNGDEGVSQ